MTPDPEAIRDLWEVDFEQEDLPDALDEAGVGRLAQLLRGDSIPTSTPRPRRSTSGGRFRSCASGSSSC